MIQAFSFTIMHCFQRIFLSQIGDLYTVIFYGEKNPQMLLY